MIQPLVEKISLKRFLPLSSASYVHFALNYKTWTADGGQLAAKLSEITMWGSRTYGIEL